MNDVSWFISNLKPIPLIPALSLSPKAQRLLFGLDKQAWTGSSSGYHSNGEVFPLPAENSKAPNSLGLVL